MNRIAASGFSLVELLVTTAILAIMAAVALPMLSANDPQKLIVAGEETANALRFALSEARRTGGYVLVDGATTAGQLKFYYSNASAQKPPTAGTAVLNDALTKRAAVLNVGGNAYAWGVALAPQFRASGSNQPQLLIGPGLSQLQGFDSAGVNRGALQANSKVLLSYAQQTLAVDIDSTTGLVTLP